MHTEHIYSPPVIEFATAAVETCLFLERCAGQSKTRFIDQSTRLLPLLYLKTTLLEKYQQDESEGFLERFVTEDDYRLVCDQVAALLGADDTFLEVFHPDMPYSDTPIAAFISENLADVYQELKDFAANFQVGEAEIMAAALAQCIEAFDEHWGQKLLNALRALHALRVGHTTGDTDSEPSAGAYRTIDRNRFTNFMTNDDDA